MSRPSPPVKISSPTLAVRVLSALLPVRMLLLSFPVPSMAAVPVRMRFSTPAGRVVVTELVRVSVMVVVALVFVPRLTLLGDVRVRVKVSSASLRLSSRMGISMV